MAPALSGIKVLDVTGMGPVSLAATMLADMGAEVIKIDPPPGASDRGVGSGLASRPQEEQERLDAYMVGKRNKKSMAINLRTEAGQRIFHKLAETADVVIEGFRPGVMENMSVGYQTLSQINPSFR